MLMKLFQFVFKVERPSQRPNKAQQLVVPIWQFHVRDIPLQQPPCHLQKNTRKSFPENNLRKRHICLKPNQCPYWQRRFWHTPTPTRSQRMTAQLTENDSLWSEELRVFLSPANAPPRYGIPEKYTACKAVLPCGSTPNRIRLGDS